MVNLNRQDDQSLVDEVDVVQDLLSAPPGSAEPIAQEVEFEPASRRNGRLFVRVLDGTGNILSETPEMSKVLPIGSFTTVVSADDEMARGTDIISLDGAPFRVLAALAEAKTPADSRTIQVGIERTKMEALLRQFRLTLAAVLATALVGCIAGAHIIVRRGLRPLAAITASVEKVRSATLHERIPTSTLPSELSVLAEAFNVMLDRLQDSFDRLSRFSADIAHELRTPVNNLRGEAEVTLARPRSREEYCQALGSCLEESVRLTRMIDDLLLMAKAEMPQSEIPREPLDVAVELAALQDFYDAAASDAQIGLEVSVDPQLQVNANRPLLQRAVGNLIENALRHTPAGGQVRLASIGENGHVQIQVSDNGCGIPETEIPRVFDRFYRVERDRSSGSGGAGLGLAIVRSIAEWHGGSVELQRRVGGGTEVTLSLPRL
jgi:two-component system heavy metal sensor histidine kinase CusS